MSSVGDFDYAELMTITLAIIICIVTGFLSLRAGYLKGQEEAVGQIRQFLEIKIGEIRTNKRGMQAHQDERSAKP